MSETYSGAIRDRQVSRSKAHWVLLRLGLSKEQIDVVRKGGLLHDIDKLGIPETILFKPGKLTIGEYQVIKRHTTHGAEIVEACHSLHPLIPVIRHHHERYDSRGQRSS